MGPEPQPFDGSFDAMRRIVGMMLVFWLLVVPGVQGSDLHLREWHVADGLPDATITVMAQTPDGCLWVGTRKGLVRFDGRKFKPVVALDGWITGLEADEAGVVWVSTRRGDVWKVGRAGAVSAVHEGDKDQEGLTDFWPDENSLWLSRDFLSSDRSGVVWYCDPRGAYLGFRPDGGVVRPEVGGATFLGWVRDPEGWLHAIQPVGTVALSPGGRGADGAELGEGGSWVEDLGESVDGRKVVKKSLTRDGVVERRLADLGDGLTAQIAVSASLVDREGRIWAARWWRGIQVSDEGDVWEDPAGLARFPRCVVTCLFEDSHGSIWAGTLGEGLYQMRRQPVASLRIAGNRSETIITSVSVGHGGVLWVGTAGDGLFEKSDGRILRHEEVGLRVTSVLADRAGRVWVGTPESLFVREGDGFESEGSAFVLALHEDRAGNVWAGTQTGLIRFGVDGSRKVYVPEAPVFLDIRCLAESPEGEIWVGGFGSGLWLVEGEHLKAVPLAGSFRQKDFRSLCFGSDGCLWIGTLYNGLYRWKNGELLNLGSKDGLPDDCIIGIHREERGVIWFSSNNGIFGCPEKTIGRYEPGGTAPLAFWQVGLEDGLESRGCSGGGQPVIAVTEDGQLHVANMTAVASFLPKDIGDLQKMRQISVETVKADGVEMLVLDAEVEVESGVRRFEFEMLAPDLLGSGHQQVSYLLEGLDREWLQTGRELTAVYSRLAPGRYTLRLRTAGMDGDWHESARPLMLRVIPAFYETMWFRVLVGMFLVVIAVLVISSRYRRKWRSKVERMRLMQAVANERARISRDMHDDLGARLTEILLIGERGAEKETGTSAGPPLEKIVVKARSAVRSLEEIVWSANPRNDSLPRLVDYLCSTGEEICECAGIRCWHEIPETIPPLPLPPDYRHHVFLAVREAFHNLVKHSGASDAWLEIGFDGDAIEIKVEDNGRGPGDGISREGEDGVRNIKFRMDICGGRCTSGRREGGGLCLVMRIPLPRDEGVFDSGLLGDSARSYE